MKLRKHRVVVAAVFLILFSCAGYWFMFVSFRSHSDLSELYNYDGSDNFRYRHHHNSAKSHRLADQLHRRHNRLNDDANIAVDHMHQNQDQQLLLRNKPADKQVVNKKRDELPYEDEFDYSEEGEIANHEIPRKTDDKSVADVQHGDREDEHKGKASLAESKGDDYSDHYDDDHRPIEISPGDGRAQSLSKNVEKLPSISRDDIRMTKSPSQAEWRPANAESVGNEDAKFGALNRDGNGDGINQLQVPVGAAKRIDGSELGEVDLDGIGVWKEKWKEKPLQRDLEHEHKQKEWHLQQVNDGVQASHARLHNVAPVPRFYGGSLLNDASNKELPKHPTSNEALDNANMESHRRSESTTSPYFIIHSGRASRVSDAQHPNMHSLPDHVQLEAYIFTSDRSF